jgi:hypothetical protein
MTKERKTNVLRTIAVILSSLTLLTLIFGFIASGNSRTAVNEAKIEKLEEAANQNTKEHKVLQDQFHVIDKKLDVLIESIKK